MPGEATPVPIVTVYGSARHGMVHAFRPGRLMGVNGAFPLTSRVVVGHPLQGRRADDIPPITHGQRAQGMESKPIKRVKLEEPDERAVI